jgi:PKD repeat protein
LLSSSDDVVFTVNAAPVNLAPVVNAGPDFTITLPNGITLAGSATDDGLPTGSTLTKSWSQVSGPGTVTFGNASALNSTANFSAAGTYTLRLTVSDSLLSSSDDVVFTVNAAPQLSPAPPVNLAPVVNAGPDFTITLPNGITLAGSATDDGLPTGSTLIKSWTKVGGPGTVTFGNAASLNSTANFSAAGTYTLRLTVSDSLLSSSDDVVFTVNAAPPVNLGPVVNAGPDQTITFPAASMLSGTATDDGLPSGTLTMAWTKVSGPGTVVFVNANSLNASATFSVPGNYTLRLSVTDGAIIGSDDVNVVVNSCGNMISGTITITANATDNVGVAGVQMKLDGANLGTFLTTAPYSIPWNSTAIPNGCHVISVVAQDGAGNQGTASLSTFVNNP